MAQENIISIPIGHPESLQGDLQIPKNAKGIVVFAHGSGSSRHSPRNRFVAEELQKGEIATLLIDLLTPKEGQVDEVTGALRFDIDLLTDRLCRVIQWIKTSPAKHLPIGLFGASTGAAAALCAAAEVKAGIVAIVSRGGRPDLASKMLDEVEAATLLIVGGYDTAVIGMNEKAYGLLKCKKQMIIVPRATHLFEEPGALEAVAQLALDWFVARFSE